MCSDKSVQRNAIKHSSAFASAEMHWDALSNRVVQFKGDSNHCRWTTVTVSITSEGCNIVRQSEK